MENQTPPPIGPKKKGTAIASLIFGIGAFCVPLISTILALLLGIQALRRIRRNPAEFGGEGMAIAGIVLGSVGLLLNIAMMPPALARAKQKAVAIKCISNLKQISIGARVWATDHNGRLPSDFLTMSNELTTPLILVCPADQVRLQTKATNWSGLTPAGISYEFLQPGRSEDELGTQVVFRCPIHGHEVPGTWGVVPGDARRR
jgi:Domain of unknown function (DUF4190)